MTIFRIRDQPRALTFEAMKMDISNTLQPIRKYLERAKVNGLPLTSAQYDDMLLQLDMINGFLDKLEEVQDAAPIGRKAIVRRLPRS